MVFSDDAHITSLMTETCKRGGYYHITIYFALEKLLDYLDRCYLKFHGENIKGYSLMKFDCSIHNIYIYMSDDFSLSQNV